MKVFNNEITPWSGLKQAIAWINKISFTPGDIAISRYFTSEEKENIDKIIVIGTSTGSGSSAYRVLSTTDILLVAGIVTKPEILVEPDTQDCLEVVDLVGGDNYIVYAPNFGHSYFFATYEKTPESGSVSGKVVYTLIQTPMVVMLYDGMLYKIFPGKPFVETMDDYYTKSEIALIHEKMDEKFSKELEKLSIKMDPPVMKINLPGGSVFEKGTSVKPKYSISITQGGNNITSEFLFLLGSESIAGSGTLPEITDTTTLTFTAISSKYGTVSGSAKITYVYPTYLGVGEPGEYGKSLEQERVFIGDLKNEVIFYLTPHQLKGIYDSSGFDYLPDYTCETIVKHNTVYYQYVKSGATTISGFTQKFINK